MDNFDPSEIAKLITEDPNIINEMGSQPGNYGSYVSEETPLDQTGNLLGRVVYEYEFVVSGRHSPAQWSSSGGSPEEYPEMEITKVTNVDLDGAFDASGKEVPEQYLPPNWREIAVKYFWTHCINDATQQQYREPGPVDEGPDHGW